MIRRSFTTALSFTLSFSLAFAFSLAFLFAPEPSALAQPMMVDPSRMSGIPRPDPQVPAGTITVRLIRGELSNRMVGVEVELEGQDGAKQQQKTDENGRATFSGLQGGPFVAHAKDEAGEALSSQSIELPSGTGVRVMLVFRAGTLGSADGVARPDKSVPPLTVVVKAVDGEGKPIPGLEAIIGHARQGESKVSELKAKTNQTGEARFSGLDAKPTSGYLAEVVKDGARYTGKPFKLSENLGSRVVIEVRPVTKDLSALSIDQGSHIIAEVTDDALQVMEIWRLHNGGTTAIDVGPGGLHLPLPDKAVSPSAGPQAPAGFTATGHEAVWKGPIPPGDLQLQVGFVLPYEGGTFELKQRTPIAWSEVALVTEKIDGMSVDAPGLQIEDRELQGRKLVLARGPGVSAGGEVRIAFHGLPHSDATYRLLSVGMALGILLCFGVYAAGGRGAHASRRALEATREGLIAELAGLEDKLEKSGGHASNKAGSNDTKLKKRRQELTERLMRIYRDLDEAS
jgi:hypothetical protein